MLLYRLIIVTVFLLVNASLFAQIQNKEDDQLDLILEELTESAAQNKVFVNNKEKKIDANLKTRVQLDFQNFTESPIYYFQESNYLTTKINPALTLRFGKNKNHKFSANILGLYSTIDDSRRYINIKELYYKLKLKNLSFLIGNNIERWGFTETEQPTNIINQTDFLSDYDNGEKYGETMVKIDYDSKLGNIQFLYLPFHITAKFPGLAGRFRSIFPYSKTSLYATDDLQNSASYAAKYSHNFSIFDLGFSYFNGTDRDPEFIVDYRTKSIFPLYSSLKQYGLEFQMNLGNLALKFDGALKESPSQTFKHYVTGLEYNLLNLFDSGVGLTLISEYVRNERDVENNILAENLTLGANIRLDKLSSDVKVGAALNLENGGKAYLASLEHSPADNWKIGVDFVILSELSPFNYISLDGFSINNQDVQTILDELDISEEDIKSTVTEFLNTSSNSLNLDDSEIFYPFRRDSFITLRLVKYF